MAVAVSSTNVIIDCMDTFASNYNPSATQPCQGCCVYKTQIVGCTDPMASNYNPDATQNFCPGKLNNNCCVYERRNTAAVAGTQQTTSEQIDIFLPPKTTTCEGTFFIDNGVVKNIKTNEIVKNIDCCNEKILGAAKDGFYWYWDGEQCLSIEKCSSSKPICVSCNGGTKGTISFDTWNDTYIANQGQSLQVSSPTLWQQIVNTVVNSGLTVYVDYYTGIPLNANCCKQINSFFIDGVCICEKDIKEDYKPRCISNLTEFLNFISTDDGYTFFENYFQDIGKSLGLTSSQTDFILIYINDTSINPNTGVQYLVETRLILSNALNITGGFHINFGVITNRPLLMTKGTCDQYKGYWDGTNCMCQPIVDQCVIDITEIIVVNSYDFFKNPIQIVCYDDGDDTPIGEACCNRLIKDYNLMGKWEWQSPFCLASIKEDCLPVVFSMNNQDMVVPPCENNLEITMWVYFGKPDNPCQPIPEPPEEVIIIEGEFCDIKLTPNTGTIQSAPGDVKGWTTHAAAAERQKQEAFDREQQYLASSKTCCYNIKNPILARISLTNPLINPSLVQIKEYNSTADYFDKWVELKATIPNSGTTLNFGVNLEIYQGLNCCCNYEIFIDDIQVNCTKNEPAIIVNDITCPGYNLNKVIDNKKSWVYNPGLPSVGISDYDNIEREDGSLGTLNGEGTINRTFAPSLDADIPWRYTDYWNQSSVYEKHSNLVLNSKELWLTFDMCANCPISGTTLVCPEGYTLSANTTICYSGNT